MPTLRTSVETLVFLGLAALAAAIAVIYWFVSYEAAGSVLLAGFALACAIIGLRLAAALRAAARAVPPNDEPGWPAADPDRPFLDEHGRVPTPTFGPFALGIGISLAATALVFGPAPLVVAVVPIAWGAWDWLRRASAELDAVTLDEGGEPGDNAG